MINSIVPQIQNVNISSKSLNSGKQYRNVPAFRGQAIAPKTYKKFGFAAFSAACAAFWATLRGKQSKEQKAIIKEYKNEIQQMEENHQKQLNAQKEWYEKSVSDLKQQYNSTKNNDIDVNELVSYFV